MRAGCPGIAASSNFPLPEQVGPLATAGLQSSGSSNHGSAAVLVNVALHVIVSCCRTSTVVPLLLGCGRARREIHGRCGSGGWPGPHLFLVAVFATDLRGSTRISQARARVRELFVKDLFSRDFHRITVGFTASAQFIW